MPKTPPPCPGLRAVNHSPQSSRHIHQCTSLGSLRHTILFAMLAAVAFSNHPTVAQDVPDVPDVLTERTIYVPFDKLQENFEREGRGVFVPYESFQEMWAAARAQRDDPTPSLPPVESMITRADSQAVVEGEVVRVTSRLTIEVLQDGWIRVPLRLPQSAMISATIDDAPARVVTQENQGHILLVENRKPEGSEAEIRQIELVLEYARSFEKSPGRNSVSFQPPIAPVNRWEVRVPESGVEVNVHPMLAATSVPPNASSETSNSETPSSDMADGDPGDADQAGEGGSPTNGKPVEETILLAFVGATNNVRIDWTPKSEGASGLRALVNVQSEQQVTISEGALRTTARLTYQVSRAELSQLKISVPTGHKVVDVLDENVRQWFVQDAGDTQVIDIRLFDPARERQDITIELEKFHDDASLSELTVPTLKAEDVGRQRGIVAVRVAEGLRAEPVRRVGLMQLDTAELPQRLRDAQPTFSFRYASVPFDLALRTEKVTPRIEVDQLAEVFLSPGRLTVDVLFKFDVKRAGVFEFAATVPREFEVREVRGHEQPDVVPLNIESHALSAPDDDRPAVLRVNLTSKARGRVGLYVRLERALADENLLAPTGNASAFDLMIPRPTGEYVARAHGSAVVYAPESLRLKPGDSRGVRSVSLKEAFQEIPVSCRDEFSELRPAMTLAYTDGEVTVAFSVQRRQPRVTVSQLLVVNVEPGVVSYEAMFRYDIRYSSVDSLRLDVPSAYADEMQTESSDLRDTVISPPPDDVPEGYVAWQLQGDAELLGPKFIKVVWESPIADLGIDKTVQLTVPRLIPKQVARAEGQIVLVKAETIDVAPEGLPTGLDPIDPQHDLWHGQSVPDAAAALEFHGDWSLSLVATRYRLQELKQTSIENAVVRAVMTRSNRIATQALYRMRSNRQRLQIRLPDRVAPGAVEFDNEPLRINGRPVTLERDNDDQVFHVPLVGLANNEPFLLELRYTSPGRGGRIRLPAFPDDPAVQQVHLMPYVPQEWWYLGRRGPWTPLMTVSGNPVSGQVIRLTRDAGRLIGELHRDIPIAGNPSSEFPLDGRPLLFGTLRPAPESGDLRMTLVHRNWVYAATFAVVILWGIALLPRQFMERIVALCAVAAILVLIGVFLPSLATAILNPALSIAAALVALGWLLASLVRLFPRLRNWLMRSEVAGGSHV